MATEQKSATGEVAAETQQQVHDEEACQALSRLPDHEVSTAP